MAKQVKKLLQSRTGVGGGGSLEMGNLGNAKKKEFFFWNSFRNCKSDLFLEYKIQGKSNPSGKFPMSWLFCSFIQYCSLCVCMF